MLALKREEGGHEPKNAGGSGGFSTEATLDNYCKQAPTVRNQLLWNLTLNYTLGVDHPWWPYTQLHHTLPWNPYLPNPTGKPPNICALMNAGW